MNLPALSESDEAVLTECDKEPIHIPGSIQPHGLLLVAHRRDLSVIGGAGDIEGRLAARWIGQPLPDLLGCGTLKTILDEEPEGSIVLPNAAAGVSEKFTIVLHRSNDLVLAELEPASLDFSSISHSLIELDHLATSFEKASDLKELCERAASAFRKLTGFDRVMIYRFLDDESGVVIAEDRKEGLPTFLNHHFPATDIPRQARALYIRNRVRVIPTIDYRSAPLRSPTENLSHLDLTDVGLRSVSPVHLQYLKNMGVAASASMSIVKDGILWGLVACHHLTPKPIPVDRRIQCRTLAGGLARQIRAKEEAEIFQDRVRLRGLEDTALAKLSFGEGNRTIFDTAGEYLRKILDADGFAAVQGKDVFFTGICPDTTEIQELTNGLRHLAHAQPFSSSNMATDFPEFEDKENKISGLLAVMVSTEIPTLMMWFRVEVLQVVNWAGNPHKDISADPAAMLSPRHSFEAWSELVRGHAKPWSFTDMEAAGRMAGRMLEEMQSVRLRQLNRELTLTIEENKKLIQQKEYLMQEVNHRVQNSLQLVSGFLQLQSRDIGDPVLAGHLNEAKRRLSAVALVHKRLYSDKSVEVIELSRYLTELCNDFISSLETGWADQVSANFAPVLISADRALNVGLILTELMTNAVKYAYGGNPGRLSISLEQYRNRFRLIVADFGSGKGENIPRKGFGTRILSSVALSLGGTLEEFDNEPGLRTILTAPLKS